MSLGEETVPSDANAADIYATGCSSTLRVRLFHIADDGLPTIIHIGKSLESFRRYLTV